MGYTRLKDSRFNIDLQWFGGSKSGVYASGNIDNATRSLGNTVNVPVTGWDKADDFIVAIALESQLDATWVNGNYRLEWRNKTDGGTFAVLSATGELRFGTTDLVEGNSLDSVEAICTPVNGTTYIAGSTTGGVEKEGASTFTGGDGSTSNQWSEFQFSVNASAGGIGGKEYEFQLYDVDNSAALGPSAATITLIAGATDWMVDLADTEAISDSISKIGTFLRALATTEAISDAIAKIGTFFKSLASTVGITDVVSALVMKMVSLTDTEAISDTITKIGTFFRTFTSTVGITDVFSKVGTFFRTFTSTVGITDVFSKVGTFFRTFTSTVGITDVFSKVGTFFRTFTSTVGITDVFSKVGTFFRTLADTLGITDIIDAVKGGGAKFATLFDTVGITDAGAGAGAVAFDATSWPGQQTGLNTSIATFQHTIGSITDGYVIIAIGARDETESPLAGLSIDVDGVPASFITGTFHDQSLVHSTLYGVATGSKTGDVDIDISWTNIASVGAVVASFSGVDQITSYQNGTGTTYDYGINAWYLDISSEVGNVTVDWVVNRNGVSTFGSPTQTDITSGGYTLNSSGISGAVSYGAGSASNSHEWTTTNGNRGAHSGIDLIASAGGGSAVTTILSAIRNLTSTVGITDVVSKIGTFFRALTDTEAMSDFIDAVKSGAGAKFASLADTVGITDAITKIGTFFRTLTDTEAMSDTVSKIGTFFRTLTDTEAMSDVFSNFIVKLVTLADTVGITDTITKIGTFFRTLTDTEAMSDTVSKIGTFFRALIDTGAISDVIVKSKGVFKSFADTVGITDAINAFKLSGAKYANLADTIGITDAITKVGTFFRTITDTEAMSDTVTRIGTFFKALTDTEAISDVLSKSVRRFVSLVDTEAMSDVLSKIVSKVVVLTDIETITDVISKVGTFFRTISNTVGITDILVRIGTFFRNIASTVGITDTTAGIKPDPTVYNHPFIATLTINRPSSTLTINKPIGTITRTNPIGEINGT